MAKSHAAVQVKVQTSPGWAKGLTDGFPKFVAENAIEPVVASAQKNVTIAGLEGLVRDNRWMCSSPTTGIWLSADETGASNVC